MQDRSRPKNWCYAAAVATLSAAAMVGANSGAAVAQLPGNAATAVGGVMPAAEIVLATYDLLLDSSLTCAAANCQQVLYTVATKRRLDVSQVVCEYSSFGLAEQARLTLGDSTTVDLKLDWQRVPGPWPDPQPNEYTFSRTIPLVVVAGQAISVALAGPGSSARSHCVLFGTLSVLK